MGEIIIRPVTEGDAEELLAIYAPYVTENQKIMREQKLNFFVRYTVSPVIGWDLLHHDVFCSIIVR